MTLQPILVLDFDGVIVDGIKEYWDSSRKAFEKICNHRSSINDFPSNPPESFKKLRPWVKNGWEMVLIVAEMTRKESPLAINGPSEFANSYKKNCLAALKAWEWSPKELQSSLDGIRKEAINRNKEEWLNSHTAFSGVIERIHNLSQEQINFAVLTTKSEEFTLTLLNHFQLQPSLLYGHEAGQKTDRLIAISKTHDIQGFVEDRRATLEKVINTPGLESIPCYLASWGYLKPNDHKNLPPGIHLLEQKKLMSPLENWP